MTYFTSYYALKQRGQLKAGETMLVMGAAGGVGSTAVELGKVMGARVIAAASSDEKLELCKQLGADEVINYSNESIKIASRKSLVAKVSTWFTIPSGRFRRSLLCAVWPGMVAT